MFFTYLLAVLFVCNLCSAQDAYYNPEVQQQYNGPPAQQYFQDEGLYHASPDAANRRSFQETPQFITQVFTLPDGSIKALHVPQG